MSTHDVFGWRDRALALAWGHQRSLGPHSRPVTTSIGNRSRCKSWSRLRCRIRSLLIGLTGPTPTGSALALGLEQAVVEQTVRRLERENLVRRSSDAVDEIQWELGDEDDEDVIAGELSIVVTELGFATVDCWASRSRPHFGGWPPRRADVGDAVTPDGAELASEKRRDIVGIAVVPPLRV